MINKIKHFDKIILSTIIFVIIQDYHFNHSFLIAKNIKLVIPSEIKMIQMDGKIFIFDRQIYCQLL